MAVALTEAQRAALQAHPVVRVGVDAFWPPFQFALQGKPTGYSIDLLELLADMLGIKLELVTSNSLSELLAMLEQGRVDVLTSLYVNPDRRQRFLFTQPYRSTHLALITQDLPDAPSDFDALSGRRVAMQRNDGAIALITGRWPGAKIIRYEREIDMLMALGVGEVDAVIGAALPTLYLAEVNQIVGLRLAAYLANDDRPVANTSLHYAVRKDWPWLRDALDAALAALPADRWHTLEQRWTQGLVVTPNRPARLFSLDERAFLAQLGKLRVCTVPDWLPYSKLTRAGQQRGISADLSTLIARRLQLPLETVPTETWPEALDAIRNGRCDLLPVVMDVPSRRAYLHFSAPYTRQAFVIATQRKFPFVYDLAQLGAARIAIIAGYAQGELIASRYPELDLRLVENAEQGLRLVRRGDVDGYVDSLATVAYEIQTNAWTDIKIAGSLDFDLELSVGTRKDAPLLGSAVDKALETIGQAEIDRLVGRWLSAPYQPPVDRGRVIKVLLPVLALLFGLYLWNRRLSRLNRELDAARRQLAAQALELARLATTDSLTGLSNRRKLDEALAQELVRCRRHPRPLALLLLDLDHFKRVNDSFGHLVGDRVLSELASLLRAQCRETDTPGRWGGEEFLIICPEIPAETAATLAERLRSGVAEHPFPESGQITISVGVTDFRSDDDADSLLDRVDAALYEAKRSGRNRIVVH